MSNDFAPFVAKQSTVNGRSHHNGCQTLAKYTAIIDRRRRTLIESGISVETDELSEWLFPFQKWLVQWALRVGRCLIASECGTGKTRMALEFARVILEREGGRVLILCPLAVAQQTAKEGAQLSIEVHRCKENEDVRDGINIANYDRLEKFDPSQFVAVILDESSILKSFDGKTRNLLTEMFSQTKYRLCCTATPSPNDFDELGQHAEFLGHLTAAQMRATWFINDTQDTGTAWRLKGHAEDDFWRWVATWAACVGHPRDIGFEQEGYDLPKLNMIQDVVAVDQATDRGENLFRVVDMSATNIHREMRLSTPARVEAAAKLVNDSDECWLVWCNSNYEADALAKALPDAVEVRGSDSSEEKERRLEMFVNGEARVLVSKPSIFGHGINLQHCAHVVFVGLSYSFEQFYQAVRRTWRFGQTREVQCHVITAETEGAVLQSIQRKIEQHKTMKLKMQASAKSLSTNGTERKTNADKLAEETGENWRFVHGDCLHAIVEVPADSIHFTLTSVPFADLFTYSDDEFDHGNCGGVDEFMETFDLLVDELMRVTMPGRLCAIHCLDLMASKWKDGAIELKNFSGKIVDSFMQRGWHFHSRVTIWKDPVIEMQRTKALGLLHKQLCKDSAMSRVGNAEYLCVFRKPGTNPEPISHTRDEYPVELWQRDASPVWMDVNQTKVLNGKQARDNRDERHICPLQLDIIERAIRLWTNKGDTVLSPYGGIGSEGYQAVKMGRKYLGFELKESYWREGCRFLGQAESESGNDLFAR